MLFQEDFVHTRDKILVLVSKDFKVKYNDTALGFFWSLLVPICLSITYYFVFDKILLRGKGINNYMLYLLCGNFLWHFFQGVVMSNGSVLKRNSSLLKKTSIQHELLLWGVFCSEGIHFLLTFLVLFGAMLCFRIVPSPSATAVNLGVLLLFFPFFVLGMSYLYSALNIYFRDLERIMGVFLTVWMFSSPIFYILPDTISPQLKTFYNLNPMVGFIGIFRDIFYEPGIHPENWVSPIICSILFFCVGRWLFLKLSPSFAERL